MNAKKLGVLLVILCMYGFSTFAAKLVDSDQQFIKQQLIFKPRFELTFSEKITEAINNGIAVTFVLQARLNKSTNWWFDNSVSSKLQTFKLRYYSMSRQYQLHNVSLDNRQNFISLELLIKQLSEETEFVFDLKQGGDYIETRIFLDKQALPSTMQLPTVFDQDWNINSDWQQVIIELPSKAADE